MINKFAIYDTTRNYVYMCINATQKTLFGIAMLCLHLLDVKVKIFSLYRKSKSGKTCLNRLGKCNK